MRRSRYGTDRLFAGINITPFTDVVLVLLVIFMIATPLIIQSSMKVNLPKASAAQEQPQTRIVITIDSRGAIFYENASITLSQLEAKLKGILSQQPDSPVIIMADRDVRYDIVVQVLDAAKSSGANRLSLGVEEKKKALR